MHAVTVAEETIAEDGFWSTVEREFAESLRKELISRHASHPAQSLSREARNIAVELAGESTGNTVVLAGRAGSCRGRTRRRVDRQHGRARRASWLVSWSNSPASRPATRSCSPGELARVMVEFAGRSVSAIRLFGL
ncbi:hypothetical protein F2Q68_00006474 [Brassica cretica]|uniref:Uncharacterized protein n=1 Tax=Brassica cretica TaxID=69181 RepID=A0A8S9JN41_BRACR|nr:hypothetical protein F2Q68_00006474 [Brassica cretica]